MKKSIFIIISIISSLLLINVVKAAGSYYLEFETEAKDNIYSEQKLDYKDGYLILDYDYTTDMEILSYYSNTGKLNKSINIYYVYFDMTVYDDFIYFMGEIDENDEGKLYKLDSNLSVKKGVSYDDIVTESRKSDSDLPSYIVNVRNKYNPGLYIDNGYINFVDYNGVIHSFNKDLEEKNTHQASEKEIETIYKLYIEYQKLLKNASNIEVLGFDIDSNNIVTSKFTFKESCYETNLSSMSDSEKEECFSSYLILYDQNGKEVWQKELSKNTLITDVKLAHGHILTIEKKYTVNDMITFDNTKDTINIYDMNGNKTQTITTKYGFEYLAPTTKGFAVNQDSCSNNSIYGVVYKYGDDYISSEARTSQQSGEIDSTKDGEAKGLSCTVNTQVYYLSLTVETKVTSGKGTVKAVNTTKPGELVTFVVTPDKDYELGSVKVTDANGNVVYFTDYTFTMPDSNALIEVTFVPKNPRTADIAIAAVSIIMFLTTFLVVYQYIKLTKPKGIY